MKIFQVEKGEALVQIRLLFREYVDFLDVDLCFQDFEAELEELPGKYVPPAGALFLAEENGRPLGCVALRPIDDTICELKRMYVRPEARGRGLGRELAQKVLVIARDYGYKTMYLDTLEKLDEAMSLYRSLGFKEMPAYYDNPLPDAVYWKLDLE